MSDPLREVLDAASRAGASACDAVLVLEDSLEVDVRGGEVERLVRARGQVLSVRVFHGRRAACASSSDLGADSIRALVERAGELAAASVEDAFAGLAEEAADEAPDLGLFCPETAASEADHVIELATRADAAARALDARIRPSGQARCGVRSRELRLARSDGFGGHYRTTSASLGCAPQAESGDEKQRDSWYRVARSRRELPSPEEIGRRAAERALQRLGARKPASTRAAVIYEPRTAISLLAHLGSAVLGDAVAERRSFLAGRLGETVAAEAIDLVDDGRLPGGLASRPFDGEGVATRCNPLIERGVLCGYLLDSYSGRRLGLRTNGAAQRSSRGAPAPGSSNLELVPGALEPEQIVAGTERGLLVTELIGFGLNPVTGDYSRGAAGLWIEEGRIRHAVQEVTVAGHLLDLLRSIDAVGCDLERFGALAAPTLRVREAAIAGR